MIDQVLFGRIFRLVRYGVQESHFHLQGRIPQQAQELRLGGDLGGHQVQDGDAQRAYVLMAGALLLPSQRYFRFPEWHAPEVFPGYELA